MPDGDVAGIKCGMEDCSMASPAAHAAAPLREMKWSPAEKAIARRAFDLALGRELAAVVREAKDRAAKIEEPSELWELERWLAERRQEIDRKYDYRYSVLPLVLAALIRDGSLSEDDLRGLGQDKLNAVRRVARS
jgi:Photoprotection regulator fluorescence recovery protein